MKRDFYEIVMPFVGGRSVLDIGSVGHSYVERDAYKQWNFALIAERAAKITGIDILEDQVAEARADGYPIVVGDAETFRAAEPVELVFAGDLIEHLSNPGLFLDCSHDNLVDGGRLVLCTPNTYSLAKLARVVLRRTNEPPVNPEHTCYFTPQTLEHLVTRHGFELETLEYCDLVYTEHHGSRSKRMQLALNDRISAAVPRFAQTMVAVFRKACPS